MTLNPDFEAIRHYVLVASSSSRVVMRKLAYPWTGSSWCSRPARSPPLRAHPSPSTSSRGAGPAPWRSSRNEARRTWRHAGQERSGHGTRSCLLSQTEPSEPREPLVLPQCCLPTEPVVTISSHTAVMRRSGNRNCCMQRNRTTKVLPSDFHGSALRNDMGTRRRSQSARSPAA